MTRAISQLTTQHEDMIVSATLQLSTRDNTPVATARAEITGSERFIELLSAHIGD